MCGYSVTLLHFAPAGGVSCTTKSVNTHIPASRHSKLLQNASFSASRAFCICSWRSGLRILNSADACWPSAHDRINGRNNFSIGKNISTSDCHWSWTCNSRMFTIPPQVQCKWQEAKTKFDLIFYEGKQFWRTGLYGLENVWNVHLLYNTTPTNKMVLSCISQLGNMQQTT